MKYTLLVGDCIEQMKTLPARSVQTCVTSPPYFGLRDYGTAKWEGGNPDCAHSVGAQVNQTAHVGQGHGNDFATGQRPGVDASRCRKCGAERIDRQIGLEQTPAAYVARMVEVFEEVRRVLRDDGTLWLNLGDSYSGSWGNYHPNSPPGKHGQRLKETARWNRPAYQSQEFRPPTSSIAGLKPKDLIGIPWRVAFALQEAGWYLRSDIIWHKPNPMPESVRDRPTKAHEYLFLLAKSERYYYDADAVKEPLQAKHRAEGKNSRMNVDRDPAHLKYSSGNKERRIADGKTRGRLASHMGSGVPWEDTGQGRNRRTVWPVATAPYKGAHFATFPPALITPCILAGAPKGGIVLDPFAGSGTTLQTAVNLGRKALGIELNPEYVPLIEKRMEAAQCPSE